MAGFHVAARDLLPVDVEGPSTPAAELPRYLRAFDFLKGPEKERALVDLAFGDVHRATGDLVAGEAIQRLDRQTVLNDPAHAAALKPIVCVGETLSEREAGQTETVLGTQVNGSLAGLTPEQMEETIVAYEPVWAIGTGKTATPQMAADAHAIIRAEAGESFGQEFADKLRILYGGSVKPENAHALMSEEEIDGALVGGASLDPQPFAKIVNY